MTARSVRGDSSARRRVAAVAVLLAAVGFAVLVGVDAGVGSDAFFLALGVAFLGVLGAAMIARGPDLIRIAYLVLGVCFLVASGPDLTLTRPLPLPLSVRPW